MKIEDAPPTVRTFYDKGIAAMERGNLDYAMDMFEAVLQLEPHLLETRKLLHAAAIRKRKTNPPSRLTALKHASGLLKATALLKKDPLQALEVSETLLRADPFNMKYAKALCDAAGAAELPEVAIDTLETLRNHLPDQLAVLEPLARLYRATQQHRLEYECREHIVQLDPKNPTALKALKDAAARNTMESAGWERAGSYRDLVADTGKENGDS